MFKTKYNPIPIIVFVATTWIFIIWAGGFSVETVSGILGSILILIAFWAATELVAKQRDTRFIKFYRSLNRDRFGIFLAGCMMWILVLPLVAIPLFAIGVLFPEALITNAWFAPQYIESALRITLLFGWLYALGFPVRPTKILSYSRIRSRRRLAS